MRLFLLVLSSGTCGLSSSLHRRRGSDGLPMSYVSPGQSLRLKCRCPEALGDENVWWSIKRPTGEVVTLPEISTHARVEVDNVWQSTSSINLTVLSENEQGTLCCHKRWAWPGCVVLTPDGGWNTVQVVMRAQQDEIGLSNRQEQIYDVYCTLITLTNKMLYGSMRLLVDGEERELQSVQIVKSDDYYRATRFEKRYWSEELIYDGNRLKCRWISARGTTIFSTEITVQIPVDSEGPPSHVSQIISSTPFSHVSTKAYESDDEDIGYSSSGEKKYSGNVVEKDSGSGEETDSSSGEDTDSGSGEETESGSGEETESGSGEETESGSGDETESGSGDETESGSGEETESSSGEANQGGFVEDSESPSLYVSELTPSASTLLVPTKAYNEGIEEVNDKGDGEVLKDNHQSSMLVSSTLAIQTTSIVTVQSSDRTLVSLSSSAAAFTYSSNGLTSSFTVEATPTPIYSTAIAVHEVKVPGNESQTGLSVSEEGNTHGN